MPDAPNNAWLRRRTIYSDREAATDSLYKLYKGQEYRRSHRERSLAYCSVIDTRYHLIQEVLRFVVFVDVRACVFVCFCVRSLT